ncbi:hypothetical protein [Thalassoglobus neptunius]|uniref:hypothetical protein n=1 Tax=Thalassoglobus neptunius TaxID=1938619 RepID=UPI001E42E00E|nr:hypothetical protein [Thalassoglobus neptunius]
MSDSPRTNVLLEVAKLSLRIGRKYVEPYSHAKMPPTTHPELPISVAPTPSFPP